MQEVELWLPVHRLYLQSPLRIGRITFRTVTGSMLDELEARLKKVDPDASHVIGEKMVSERKKFQGHAAAAIRVRAESSKAREITYEEGSKALALLRFLSPVNWIPNQRSYCQFVGEENVRARNSLSVREGRIVGVSTGVVEEGASAWTIADAWIAEFPGIVEQLNLVANAQTDFAKSLLDALLLYSRSPLTANPADKLVYILVALESLLLKDRNEPIQKNIGERLAFLIGETLEARKAIVSNTAAAYELRSAFVHHGESPDDIAVLKTFLLNAWTGLYNLIFAVERFPTKLALIQALEDRKLG